MSGTLAIAAFALHQYATFGAASMGSDPQEVARLLAGKIEDPRRTQEGFKKDCCLARPCSRNRQSKSTFIGLPMHCHLYENRKHLVVAPVGDMSEHFISTCALQLSPESHPFLPFIKPFLYSVHEHFKNYLLLELL